MEETETPGSNRRRKRSGGRGGKGRRCRVWVVKGKVGAGPAAGERGTEDEGGEEEPKTRLPRQGSGSASPCREDLEFQAPGESSQGLSKQRAVVGEGMDEVRRS